ncbi:MAG: glycoside hydrolase family 5 protein [Cytophagaceae bacterium]|jgi:endoglucanase|nr:glycoside hydrolase family 5 protein [Cytophagaceae bacterium]
MKKSILLVLLILNVIHSNLKAEKDIVFRYGHLSVSGNYILSQYKDTVQLRGMSLFWSQWMPEYYNYETIKWLKEDWKCTVIRAAMGVEEEGGYLYNPDIEEEKICTVIEAAIDLGIYVIIDYHSHKAHKNPALAKSFFEKMSKKYSKYPNVLYEIFNEPLQDASWTNQIKPYAEDIISTIRKNDSDNIIIVGTRQWSQMVTEAASNPIIEKNIMYTLHFYAVSHGKYLRDEAEKAMKMGIAIFVTEFGDCDYTGDGELGYNATNEWFEFMEKYKLSWCNWSVSHKNETSAILKPKAGISEWEDYMLSASGVYIRKVLIQKYKNELYNYLLYKKKLKQKKSSI